MVVEKKNGYRAALESKNICAGENKDFKCIVFLANYILY